MVLSEKIKRIQKLTRARSYISFFSIKKNVNTTIRAPKYLCTAPLASHNRIKLYSLNLFSIKANFIFEVLIYANLLVFLNYVKYNQEIFPLFQKAILNSHFLISISH